MLPPVNLEAWLLEVPSKNLPSILLQVVPSHVVEGLTELVVTYISPTP